MTMLHELNHTVKQSNPKSSILRNNEDGLIFHTGLVNCLHRHFCKFNDVAPQHYKNIALQISQKYFDGYKEFPEFYTPLNYIAIPTNVSKEDLLIFMINCRRLMDDLNEDIINPVKENTLIREFLKEITTVSNKKNPKFFPFFMLGFYGLSYDMLSNLIKHISIKIDSYYRNTRVKRNIPVNTLLNGNVFKILSLLPKLPYDILDDFHNLNSNTSFNKEIESLLNQYFIKDHYRLEKSFLREPIVKSKSLELEEPVLSKEDALELEELLKTV